MRAITAAAASVVVGAAACAGPDLQQRQADVAERGRAAMPFDLDATTHVFEKLGDGGLQTVVADAPDDEQVSRIRSHLAAEAERFAHGDFHDPATVHGDAMPGLHALVTGHGRIEITYRDVERGAEIRYATSDAALVPAIHEWFDAQVMDHGTHAQDHR